MLYTKGADDMVVPLLSPDPDVATTVGMVSQWLLRVQHPASPRQRLLIVGRGG